MTGTGPRVLVVEADGGSRGNPGPAGYGAHVLDAATGEVLAERAGYLGVTTNNVAEYTGLVAGLRAAVAIDPDARIEVRMDSRLVVEQMSGRWQVKHADMRRLADEARAVVRPGNVTYTWIPRAENAAADRLANEAMDTRGDVVRDHPGGGTDLAGDPAPQGTGSADDVATADAGDRAATLAAPRGGPRRSFDPALATTLLLVRHGQTPLTVDGAYSGSVAPGPSLTTRGRAQAAHAADLVRRVGRTAWTDLPTASAIVASPLARAHETAQAVGRRIGAHVRTDDRLTECAFGDWESLTAPQIAAGWPGGLEAWYESGTHAPPGGESVQDVGERVAPAIEEVVAAHPGATVAVVGHTVQIRAVVGRALGAPPARWSSLRLPPGSLSIVRTWPGGFSEVVAVGVPSDL
ncbi:putative phosphoglycerate mutase [Sediminihabitans luteus]|uniref:Putative phosphoglycerate mutase n=1 Tax=Sediminihabitans luteus TaxID=1138585 RepID=A0A2M9CPZ3_9CELL|nr:bifunctional RNase H/acid phosphatase [Sediminihabitans luteus]PJJ73992.1 putative phosphoglycerate mutase [Sediminihabitans luteus]GII98095.1 bifunctional RNase H/acid phosphatase [Sediminihabitans luteus]